MIKPGIEIRGVHATTIAMQKMVQGDAIKIHDGMILCGRAILRESQRLVPKDTLALLKSSRLTVEGTGLNTVCQVDYGGETAPYAWIVHYDPTKHHAPPTQSHYLTEAIHNTKVECQQILMRTMRSWLYQGTSQDRYADEPVGIL